MLIKCRRFLNNPKVKDNGSITFAFWVVNALWVSILCWSRQTKGGRLVVFCWRQMRISYGFFCPPLNTKVGMSVCLSVWFQLKGALNDSSSSYTELLVKQISSSSFPFFVFHSLISRTYFPIYFSSFLSSLYFYFFWIGSSMLSLLHTLQP